MRYHTLSWENQNAYFDFWLANNNISFCALEKNAQLRKKQEKLLSANFR
jgi:hypothetical protein